METLRTKRWKETPFPYAVQRGAQEKKRRNKLRDYGSASSRAFRAKLRARTLEFYVWRFAVEVCQLHPSLPR